MNYIRNLRIFGTIYLWIFVAKVLQVRGGQYHNDARAKSPESEVRFRTNDVGSSSSGGGGGVMIKPLTIQIFDDYTDELVNERGSSDNVVAAVAPAPAPVLPSTATTEAVWQTLDKHLYYNRLPLISTKFKTMGNSNNNNDDNNNNNYFYNKNKGNSLTSKAITFENLNDFRNRGFWPEIGQQHQHQQQKQKQYQYDGQQQPERRHSLIHAIYPKDGKPATIGFTSRVDKQNPVTNIRYEILPMFMEKYFETKNFKPTTRKAKAKRSKSFTTMMANNNINDNDNVNDNDNGNGIRGIRNSNRADTFRLRDDDIVKENLFPFKDDDEHISDFAFNVNIDDDGIDGGGAESSMANKNDKGNGNGNESLNYADNNVLNTNYFTAQSNTDIDKESPPPRHVINQHMNRNSLMDQLIGKMYDKRAKPSVGHTPFLPAVSGGAMTNLGKFFRDLSKNVHFSEQYQWSAEQQKLLEGDPNFSNIQYHLEKPNAATDQQTAEWIKAIRFYRPSQKIRSLVAMNPHGQWAHSSQFIDPNYMWVGLGK